MEHGGYEANSPAAHPSLPVLEPIRKKNRIAPTHASDSLRTESGGYGNERAIQICTAHTTEAQGSYRSPRLRWCRRRDLNPHGLRHTPLKRACLPFHHFGILIHAASHVKRIS